MVERWLTPALFCASGVVSAWLVGSLAPLFVSLGALGAWWGLTPRKPVQRTLELEGARAPETVLDELPDQLRERVLRLEGMRSSLLSLIQERAQGQSRLWEPELRRVDEAFDGFVRLAARHGRNQRFLQTPGADPSGQLSASQDQLEQRMEEVEGALVAVRDQLAASDGDGAQVVASLDALQAGVSAVQSAEAETRQLVEQGRRSLSARH